MIKQFTKLRWETTEEIKDRDEILLLNLILDNCVMQKTTKPTAKQKDFCNRFNIDKRTVSKRIANLIENGYIKAKTKYNLEGNCTQFEIMDKSIRFLDENELNKIGLYNIDNSISDDEEIEYNSNLNLPIETATNKQVHGEIEISKQIAPSIKADTAEQVETISNDNVIEIDDDLALQMDDFNLADEESQTETIQVETIQNDEEKPYNENNKIDFDLIQNTIVNKYENAMDKNNGKTGKLFEALISKYPSINYLRGNLAMWSKELKQEYKRTNIPLSSVSVLFNEQDKQRTKNNIKKYNNIIAIDIDKQDNLDLDMQIIRNRICNFPFIFYCSKSVSGEGLFALVYLDGTIEDFEAHFLSLENYFKKHGIVIDKACKDATRLRYCTQDDDIFINKNACIYSGKQYKTMPTAIKNNKNFNTKQSFLEYQTIYNCAVDEEAEKKLNTIIEDCKKSGIILNPTHKETLLISKAIANDLGESGFNYLLQFAEMKHGQNTDIDKYRNLFYNDLNTKTDLHLPSVYRLYKEAKGIEKIKW